MFNSILLLDYSPEPSSVKTSAIFPKDYDISDDIEMIKACSFPSNVKLGESTVHIFNTTNYTCHSYVFTFASKIYAIVVNTVSFHPCLFSDFLKAVAKSFEGDERSDPEVRFSLVRSLLTSWEYNGSDKLVVNYPYNSFTIDLGATENWTQSFDISPLSSAIEHLWKALLSNLGILIIGATAEIASNALLAALSIIEPLKYFDPLLIYTRKGDPRFQEILEGSKKYKLVATTENFVPQKNQFGVIFNIPEGHFTPCPELQEQYQQRTARFFTVVLGAMNQALLVDPYFDILDKKIDNMQTYTSNASLFKKAFFDKVETTETFKRWRNRRKIRDETRAAFLSVPPIEALKKLPDDMLEIANEELLRIYNTSDGDMHLQTVLKIHLKAVAKRIKKLKNQESQKEAEEPKKESTEETQKKEKEVTEKDSSDDYVISLPKEN